MNELHLFAGAGGGILGGELLGHTCVCAVEIEPYCREVLLQRQRDGILPKFPIWDDVRTFDGKPWRGIVDVICGGFPCQDISCAGKGAGIKGARSGLWSEFARIVGEVQPRFAFVENSPMLTVRGLGRVLGDFSEMGYDAVWCVLGGDAINSLCAGKRMWILAYAPNCQRWNEVEIQTKISHQKQSRRRQLERAIGACLSEETDAEMRRNPNAFPHWVDRLKAIGNAQVPLLAATAFRLLRKKIEKETRE